MTKMPNELVYDMFSAVVVADPDLVDGRPHYDLVRYGIVTDFEPAPGMLDFLASLNEPIEMKTLFSREERLTSTDVELMTKQFMHYVEVYGLGMPGLFDLTVDGGSVVKARFIQGITLDMLAEKVRKIAYANAPVKDVKALAEIIRHFGITVDISRMQNNELRIQIWNRTMGPFDDGDDAVRWLAFTATGDSLLIKSPEVINKLRLTKIFPEFFDMHEHVLAQVFNRHKALILAAKHVNPPAVNRISRLSKTEHVPVGTPPSKSWVTRALNDNAVSDFELRHFSVRDKFKFLNLLSYKQVQSTVDAFRIRNGKVKVVEGRRTYDERSISRVARMVLHSLSFDLEHLRGKKILLDHDIDYGLPVSAKQTIGRLPYGTIVIPCSQASISSGIYWRDEWGASDLDLSALSLDGGRVGWGSYRAFADQDIIFSGDMTSARHGATEFFTSKDQTYGLLVNIFAGDKGAEMELIVGNAAKHSKKWIDDIVIRERHTLDSRECILGYVRKGHFVVWGGRLNDQHVSRGGKNPALEAMRGNYFTIGGLLSELDIDYSVDFDPSIEYDYDLSYESLSFDKLTALFETPA